MSTTVDSSEPPRTAAASSPRPTSPSIAAFAALISACAYVGAIPVGGTGVPITLQTFGVMLAGCVLGPVRGFLATALYLGLGAIGLPVFAEHSSGLGVFTGPSVGYLISFPFAALVGGLLVKYVAGPHRQDPRPLRLPVLARRQRAGDPPPRHRRHEALLRRLLGDGRQLRRAVLDRRPPQDHAGRPDRGRGAPRVPAACCAGADGADALHGHHHVRRRRRHGGDPERRPGRPGAHHARADRAPRSASSARTAPASPPWPGSSTACVAPTTGQGAGRRASTWRATVPAYAVGWRSASPTRPPSW